MTEPTDRIYVTAAQVRAAQLIIERDAANGRASDSAVVAIAQAQKAVVRERQSRRAG